MEFRSQSICPNTWPSWADRDRGHRNNIKDKGMTNERQLHTRGPINIGDVGSEHGAGAITDGPTGGGGPNKGGPKRSHVLRMITHGADWKHRQFVGHVDRWDDCIVGWIS